MSRPLPPSQRLRCLNRSNTEPPCGVCPLCSPERWQREYSERVAMQERARDAAMQPRRGSLRTFFDARFRARWWVLLPLCWGLLLAAGALTWYIVR